MNLVFALAVASSVQTQVFRQAVCLLNFVRPN
jgi:hypothetical protein